MRNSLLMLALFAFQVSMDAQQLEEILQSHFKAAAQDKMGNIETIITHGKNRYSMGGIESSFIIYQARPNKIRIESQFQGSEVVQTYNGGANWAAGDQILTKQ